MEYFLSTYFWNKLHVCEDNISQLTLIENVEIWNTDSLLLSCSFCDVYKHVFTSMCLDIFEDKLD